MIRITYFITCVLLSVFSYAQDIPVDRLLDWSSALKSYDYRIPAKEMNVRDFGAIGDGNSDDQPAIMKAIASLKGKPGSIYFPEGTYLLQNTVSLPDSVNLHGDGADRCELRFDLGKKNKNCIVISKNQSSPGISLESGYTKESVRLVCDSSFVFHEGDHAIIFQENGNWDDKPMRWAKNAIGQIIRIEYVIGDTIYLEDPLRISYLQEFFPKIRKLNMTSNSGVSCLKISRIDKPEKGGGANILMRYAANCFIRGVESNTSAGAHIDIFSSTRILVDGCYIHHAFSYDGVSKHGYGICLNNQSGECLITNNIFQHLRHSMMVKTGANGNVFSYNYSFDVSRSEWPFNFTGDISLHGHYPYANLFEGNIVQNILTDHYWGPSGPLNTFFRNRIELFGIIITGGNPTYTDKQSFIGNEIINNSFFYGHMILFGSDHFKFGNNLTGSIVPEGTNSLKKSSLYLTSRPTFWISTSDWPTIGIPNNQDSKSIPAKERYIEGNQLTCCPNSSPGSLPTKAKGTGAF